MSYRKKHIKNKIHKITPKKSISKRPIFWFFSLFLVLVIIAAYFYLFFSGFQIKNIIISGNKKVLSKDIENLVTVEINKKFTKSIFLTNPPELQKVILNAFPIIESVIIEKQLPQNINLKIEERKPVAVYCSPCFLIDKNGVIFEETQDTSQNMLVLKQSINNTEPFLGESVIEKNIMNVILKIEKNLKENFQINIKEAFLSNPLRLDIITSENWKIFFNLEADTDLQIIKLSTLLKDEVTQTKREGLQYIDLRFKDKAYFK